MLDAGNIIEAAEATVGVDDSDRALRPNLEHLVASINEDGAMTPRGEAMARQALVRRTADRLQGLGLPSLEDVRQAVADWRRRNPKGARGANPYALEQFGLNEDMAAEQYADYMRHFDIAREKDRL